jgi:hypothetical protein
MATKSQSPESAPEATAKTPEKQLMVKQPDQLVDMMGEIETIKEEVSGKVDEDNKGGAMQSTSKGGGQAQDDQTSASQRKQLMANLPSEKIMQQKLKQHIAREVKNLRKETRKIIRLNKPGSAYQLTMLYARIRRLNALLVSLVEASYEVIKRFFVRVYVDERSIL